MIIMVWQCWRKLPFSLMASSESFWIILGFSLVVFLYLLRAVKPFSWRFGKVFFCITPMLIALKKNFTTSQAILEYFLVCLVIIFFISWKLFVWVLMKICTYILNNTLWWLLHYKSLGKGVGGGWYSPLLCASLSFVLFAGEEVTISVFSSFLRNVLFHEILIYIYHPGTIALLLFLLDTILYPNIVICKQVGLYYSVFIFTIILLLLIED